MQPPKAIREMTRKNLIALNVPLCLRSQSTSVVFPWSTWAIIATFRIESFLIYIFLFQKKTPLKSGAFFNK